MAADLAAGAESLAAAGLDWLVGSALTTGEGLVWTGRPDDAEVDPTLYSGAAGIVVTLLEAHRHLGDDRWAAAAAQGAQALAVRPDETSSSLYFGLSGTAFALHQVGTALDRTDLVATATRARDVVRSRFDGERWADQFELLGGNAGIALGALAAGDTGLALLAVEPYTRTTEATPYGVHWEVRRGIPARFHHISHGTLGIVHALASVGAATGRVDLVRLALLGAADVVSRDEAGPDGFLVPHSDPQHKPEIVERYSNGWCHGPAGDAQTFRLLAGGRPGRRGTHRPGVRPGAGRRPGRARDPGRRGSPVVQPRAPRHAERAGPAPRLGDGQCGDRARAAAVRAGRGRARSGVRRRLAGPPAGVTGPDRYFGGKVRA
jgi:hypothetical protein